MDITKEIIEDEVVEWVNTFFDDSFSFRKYQKETCVDIIYSFLTGEKNYILEAPTGSGKSIMAMIIGGVLTSYHKKRGYVLISDLSLIEQYERDVRRFSLDSFGVIKGQENYNCPMEGTSFKNAPCQVRGDKNYFGLYTQAKKCPSGSECAYLIARFHALETNLTICTYHLWLTYQNMEMNKTFGDEAPFGKRDFIICDEAHKLVDIIQSMYSIRISNVERNMVTSITSVRKEEFSPRDKKIQNTFDNILNNSDNIEILFHEVTKLRDLLDEHCDGGRLTMQKSDDYDLPHYKCVKLSHAVNALDEYLQSINMFIASVSGKLDQIVVTKTNYPEEIMTLNCLDEKFLMEKLFYPHYTNALFMSATIGDLGVFAMNAHMNSYKSLRLDSTFDFTKSPIFYCPTYKMNYDNKETSIPHIIEMIKKIVYMFPDRRGCILTSSYDMMRKIYNSVDNDIKERMQTYDNSKNKREILGKFRYYDNAILIGPSLFDGLSFDDDLCRFLIIAKVPYPDLSSNFIKKKMQTNFLWYSGQASLSIIQGVGRGVRSENDWCYSFILDGCIEKLLEINSKMYGKQILSRFIKIDENLKVI